jgi:hypothetical protein
MPFLFCPFVKLIEIDVGEQWANSPSYNVAKSVIDFSITVPRERLRPNYGDGFQGAPLQPGLLSKRKTERKRGANGDEAQPAREGKTAGKTHL